MTGNTDLYYANHAFSTNQFWLYNPERFIQQISEKPIKIKLNNFLDFYH